MNDLLEQRLADALGAARTDDRWAVPPQPGAYQAVRRGARRRRQRTTALGTAAGVLAVVGVVGLAGTSLPGSQDRVVGGVAAPPAAGGEPVPGVQPEWRPASGREWLMTGPEWDAFMAVHEVPETGGQSRVPSPAPLAPASGQLLQEVEPVLPEGARAQREDAVGGDPDTSAVHVQLADGTPIEIERRQLPGPLPWDRLGGDGPAPQGTRVEDVPGTTTALLLQPGVGYGFPGWTGGANGVLVVTRDGLATFWVAPVVVPVETLRSWALAALPG